MEKILEQPTAKATGSEVQFVMRSETKAQGISSVFEPTPLHRLPLSNTYYCNQVISLPIFETGSGPPGLQTQWRCYATTLGGPPERLFRQPGSQSSRSLERLILEALKNQDNPYACRVTKLAPLKTSL